MLTKLLLKKSGLFFKIWVFFIMFKFGDLFFFIKFFIFFINDIYMNKFNKWIFKNSNQINNTIDLKQKYSIIYLLIRTLVKKLLTQIFCCNFFIL